MTLPFRRRHHDHESGHDRARALISAELLEPLTEAETAWLEQHLDGCDPCRRDREGYAADQAMLRGLRATTPEPPRDLWARTSAAIDRESRGFRRGATRAASQTNRQLWRTMPLGAVAGALVVVVVVGSALLTRNVPQVVPPQGSQVAQGSAPPPPPQPTPLTLTAASEVGWVRPAANGRWELVISEVDEVCPTSRKGCQELGGDAQSRTVDLGDTPTGMTLSPANDQLVVQSRGSAAQPGTVFVVPLATQGPGETGAPATDAPPSLEPATDAPPTLGPPTTPPATEAPPSPDPAATPTPTPDGPTAAPTESPRSTPSGAIEIASGVTMVGEAAYSEDGAWLAFSARPADDSTGPDLYLWRVGDPAGALPVTADHRTYFSGWLGNAVLASEVLVPAAVGPEAPEASLAATPEPTAEAPTEGPPASAGASEALPEFHPISFLMDPATGARTSLTQPDVWLPVVDSGRRVTAFWSGTLRPTADGLDWQLGEGRLVLDRWVEPGAAPSSSEPAAASSDPSTEPAADPSGEPSGVPLEVVGPAGAPVELEVGEIVEFTARFDPEGTRLGIWTADERASDVGRLHLVVVDPATGTVDATVKPLPGAPALRRFSMDAGRLAWVSPRGQDGQESAVQVLGWKDRDFGEIQTIPAKDLFIVR